MGLRIPASPHRDRDAGQIAIVLSETGKAHMAKTCTKRQLQPSLLAELVPLLPFSARLYFPIFTISPHRLPKPAERRLRRQLGLALSKTGSGEVRRPATATSPARRILSACPFRTVDVEAWLAASQLILDSVDEGFALLLSSLTALLPLLIQKARKLNKTFILPLDIAVQRSDSDCCCNLVVANGKPHPHPPT